MRNRISAMAKAACTAVCIVLSGCTAQNLETTYSSQESKIDSFISSQLAENPDIEVIHYNGSNRLVLVQGKDDPAGADWRVTFKYAGYIFTGSISNSNLFATNSEEVAADAGWNLTGSESEWETVSVRLDDKDLIAGLRNGLVGTKNGEECYVVFSGKYGFGKKVLGTIPANSALLYHIWVESVSE